MGECAGVALRAFSSQMIASSVRDCSRCTAPICKYQMPIAGSRGLRRMACSASGIDSSIDPVKNLHQPSCPIALTELRLDASAVSYSGMASANRRCARNTWPLAICASGLRGDTAKPARRALLRGRCRPQARRPSHRAPGMRARSPIGSTSRRTADRAPMRVRKGRSPRHSCRAMAASSSQRVHEECSPARWDQASCGRLRLRATQG